MYVKGYEIQLANQKIASTQNQQQSKVRGSRVSWSEEGILNRKQLTE